MSTASRENPLALAVGWFSRAATAHDLSEVAIAINRALVARTQKTTSQGGTFLWGIAPRRSTQTANTAASVSIRSASSPCAPFNTASLARLPNNRCGP